MSTIDKIIRMSPQGPAGPAVGGPLYLTANFYGPEELLAGSDGRMFIGVSVDGITWAHVGGFVYTAPNGDFLRDPHILKHNGTWWCSYTRDVGLTADSWGLASSPDLITWTHVTDVEVGTADGCWGPKWVVDPTTGLPWIVFETDPNAGPHKLMRPLNDAMTEWSEPTLMGLNGFDGEIFALNGVFYFGYHNGGTGFRLAKSATIDGTYEIVAGLANPWLPAATEAFTFVQKADGTFRIYLFKPGTGFYDYHFVELDGADIETATVGALQETYWPEIWKYNNGNRFKFKDPSNGSVKHVTDAGELADIYAAIMQQGLVTRYMLEVFPQLHGENDFDRWQRVTLDGIGLRARASTNQGVGGVAVYDRYVGTDRIGLFYGEEYAPGILGGGKAGIQCKDPILYFFSDDEQMASWSMSSGVLALTKTGSAFKTADGTVAQLPAPPARGMRSHVTDATATAFWAIVAGGGANSVPVFYDGANWRIA